MQRQQQRCTETATANGNGETPTEERQRNGGNQALGQSPKVNLWKLLERDFLQVICPSCHPTKSIKALHLHEQTRLTIICFKQSWLLSVINNLQRFHWIEHTCGATKKPEKSCKNKSRTRSKVTEKVHYDKLLHRPMAGSTLQSKTN